MYKKIITSGFVFLLMFSTPSMAGWKKNAWNIFKNTVTKTAEIALETIISPSVGAEAVERLNNKLSTLEAGLNEFDIAGNRPDNFTEIQSTILSLRNLVANIDSRVTTLEEKVNNLESRLQFMSSNGSAINQALPQKERNKILRLIEPSFKCSKAKEDIELSICQSLVLRDIDGKMGKIYWELRSHFSSSISSQIRLEQLGWLKKRDAKCDPYDEECLVGVYQERITELKSRF